MGLVFTYVLTFVGAVGSLAYPLLGLLVYICFAIIKPELLWHWAFFGPGNFSRIVAVAMLAGWAIQGFGRWDFGRGKAIVISIVGFLVWAVWGALVASNQELAWAWIDNLF